MNDKQRVTEYMDGLTGREMRVCNPGSMGCACMGCIMQCTPEQAKQYLLDKVEAIDLVIEQRKTERLNQLKERLNERKNGNDKGL
jgi:hypothetical protein